MEDTDDEDDDDDFDLPGISLPVSSLLITIFVNINHTLEDLILWLD